jgi:hypothetical protein
VIVVTGCNAWDGFEIVLEGEAIAITDPDRLARLAAAFTQKYDDFFGFRLVDGRLTGSGASDELIAFEVRASKGFGFGKGATFSHTRWSFTE